MKSNSELRAEARKSLKGKWATTALFYFVYSLIAGGVGTLFSAVIPGSNIIIVFLLLPMGFNFTVGLLRQFRGEEMELGWLFENFKKQPWVTLIYKNVYLILWTLLLIIPGAIKSYSYAMTEYIIHDDPSIQNDAAIEKSMAMMSGHKLDLFLLDLSFLGWYLLSLLTLGIAAFWVGSYHHTARAAFYEQLKSEC